MTHTDRPNSPADWEYEDDCPVCQAMRLGDEAGRELTREELDSAFQAAKLVTPWAGTWEDFLRKKYGK